MDGCLQQIPGIQAGDSTCPTVGKQPRTMKAKHITWSKQLILLFFVSSNLGKPEKDLGHITLNKRNKYKKHPNKLPNPSLVLLLLPKNFRGQYVHTKNIGALWNYIIPVCMNTCVHACVRVWVPVGMTRPSSICFFREGDDSSRNSRVADLGWSLSGFGSNPHEKSYPDPTLSNIFLW